MSIFSEYSGPSGERGYYSAADWNKLQNPDWAKDQAEYDRFAAQAAARAESRAEAMSRAREAIPFSYTQFGRGGTEPVFSLAGYSGHTSGGTAGLSGFAGTGSPVGYSSSGGGSTSGGGNPGVPDPGDRGPDVDERAEGGVILPVQHMQEGGMIQSPYADPMKSTMQAMPMPQTQINMGPMPGSMEFQGRVPNNLAEIEASLSPLVSPMQHVLGPSIQGPNGMSSQDLRPIGGMQGLGVVPMGDLQPRNDVARQGPGVGGLFEAQFDQAGPLSQYQRYLMETYYAPTMNNVDQMVRDDVNYFVDLVNQAERAHFGQGSAQPQAQTPLDRGIASLPAAY